MTIRLHVGDLPAGLVRGPGVAVDTETLGLDATRDRLCVVQLSDGDGTAELVRFAPARRARPISSRCSPIRTLKLFHFARFDLADVLTPS